MPELMRKITMATMRRRSECTRSVVAMVSSKPAEVAVPKAGRDVAAVASPPDACIEKE